MNYLQKCVFYPYFIENNPRPGSLFFLYIENPACRPFLLLDGASISSQAESLLVMEGASCSLSMWLKQWPFEEKYVSWYTEVYTRIVRSSLRLDECGVSHNDAHPGNIGLFMKDKRGVDITNALMSFKADYTGPWQVKFFDFGKSSWGVYSADDVKDVSQGLPSFMAPSGFFPSDGWAVYILAFFMAGLTLPWYKINCDEKGRRVHIDKVRTSCLLGDHFCRTEAHLVALLDGTTKVAWRLDAMGLLRRKQWPFLGFMEALFKSLISDELNVLRTGRRTQSWSAGIRSVPIQDAR
jgi:hypothetical protein